MPVISSRRSSITSGSLYVTPVSSSTTTTSSPGLNINSSFLDRGNSLTKASSTSLYNSNYGLNSYTPRTTYSYRSSGTPSAYSSGEGFSKYTDYRSPSTYLKSSNDINFSSRYGKSTKSKTSTDPLRNGSHHETNNKSSNSISASGNSKNNNRLLSSYSSSSLARLVATSGLDLYEKYSPAHYIPRHEVARSRSSLTETPSFGSTNQKLADNSKEETRDRSGCFDYNSNDDVVVGVAGKRYTNLSTNKSLNSSSSSSSLKCSFSNTNTNAVPINKNNNNNNTINNNNNLTAHQNSNDGYDDDIDRYTLYNNRLHRPTAVSRTANKNDDIKNDDENTLKNVCHLESNYNSIDRIAATRNHFKDLIISCATAPSYTDSTDNKETVHIPSVIATSTTSKCSNGNGAPMDTQSVANYCKIARQLRGID